MLKVNDPLVVYFIQQPPRVRKFHIRGIYQTGLEEFDNLYMLCHFVQVQKLNDWKPDQVGGFEVMLRDFEELDHVAKVIYNEAGYQFNSQTIKELYPQIFNWLDLQNINVYIIIALMVLVASINMISTLLILVLENVSMIGILKSIGARNVSIRGIFLYMAFFLVGAGMVAGNIIALTLCGLQYYYGIIKLPQESYYVSVVPVNLSVAYLLAVNAGTLLCCMLMLLVPSMVVSKISPVRAIRFD
jgi:lipoprotein-releasing system permease protein